jgi:hypothetical protein
MSYDEYRLAFRPSSVVFRPVIVEDSYGALKVSNTGRSFA